MVYTSYFGYLSRTARIGSGVLKPMSIALIHPRGWDIDPVCPCLRPLEFMVRQYKDGTLTPIGYELRYRECVLQNISQEWVAKYYDNCVLCCYEKPEDFCHRHIVRKWLREAGIHCLELDHQDVDCWSGEMPAHLREKPRDQGNPQNEGAQLCLF